MEKKETAVDWLYEKIKSHFEHDGDLLESLITTTSVAKQKERNQIEEAYKAALPLDDNPDYMADKYYKKTFNPSPCVNS